MSHVDDGTLNAYLDGELSAMEHARVETHVAECPACRARLEETRTLIQRAGQLLDLAVPPQPERAMPPLHQLRHPRPRLLVRPALAWAATVVLAIAAGWYARGITEPTAFTAPSLDTAARQVAARAPAGAPARDNTRGPGAPSSRADSAAKTPTAAAEMDRLADRPAEPAAAGGAAPQPVAGLASGVAATAEAKISSAPTFAIIPGLPVKSVRAGAGGSTIIEQQLDSTTVITLIEWRSAAERGDVSTAQRSRAAAPTAAPAAPAAPAASAVRGSERLARYVGPWRIEITGPLTVDSLSKLLERVRAPD